jgi:hypothetical protein
MPELSARLPSPPRRARRAALCALAACLAVLLGAGAPAEARDAPPAERSGIEAVLVTNDQRRAVDRAAKWIAAAQKPGGMWGDEKATRVADTALCALALMAAGSTVTSGPPLAGGGRGDETLRGPHARQVRAALQYLARLAWSDTPGKPAGYIADDAESQMHGHGFAMLTLAQACGNLAPSSLKSIREFIASGEPASKLSLADQVRWGLERAVRLTEAAQDVEAGGWYYTPTEGGHEGSMTVTQIVGLRAARDAGVAVNGVVMRRAYDYLRDSQNVTNPDLIGGFAYEKSHLDRVSYALTGAALSTMFGLGRYGENTEDKAIIERGLRFMDRRFADAIDADGDSQQWFYYRWFYGSLTLYLSNDERRIRDQWPRLRRTILSYQHKDGFFRKLGPASEPGGVEYSTAMACLALEVPLESLPIFQRR